MSKQLRPMEEWARRIMGRHLGASVEQHDDGSRPSMYDLHIRYADGREGATEVTSATDPRSTSLAKEMYRGGQRWQFAELRGGWMISVRHSTPIKKMRPLLPGALLELEQRGIRSFSDPWDLPGGLAERFDSLGIEDAFQSGTDFPGSMYCRVADENIGGFVAATGEPLTEWIAQFLKDQRRSDLRHKLAASGLPERHAFVPLHVFTDAPFQVVDLLIREGPLPIEPPDLPHEVTDVWVATVWDVGSGMRWSGHRGWERFDTSSTD